MTTPGTPPENDQRANDQRGYPGLSLPHRRLRQGYAGALSYTPPSPRTTLTACNAYEGRTNFVAGAAADTSSLQLADIVSTSASITIAHRHPSPYSRDLACHRSTTIIMHVADVPPAPPVRLHPDIERQGLPPTEIRDGVELCWYNKAGPQPYRHMHAAKRDPKTSSRRQRLCLSATGVVPPKPLGCFHPVIEQRGLRRLDHHTDPRTSTT
ncbi:hypothetical protein C8F01DRAFT_1255162 [Mycena amicta]|nr:hypothetical protein C8F01DRAFT_1255162 [Mycena amicta]